MTQRIFARHDRSSHGPVATLPRSCRQMIMFGFQRLDVYRCAVSFLGAAARLAEGTPRGYSSLADQLRRAALSVPLNIAEAGGKSEADARRYYAIARGSALECAAIVDAFEALRFASSDDLAEPRETLERVVSMLTRLTRPAPAPAAPVA